MNRYKRTKSWRTWDIVDINGPNIDADVDINAPSALLRYPKPKKGEIKASVPEVNIQGNIF